MERGRVGSPGSGPECPLSAAGARGDTHGREGWWSCFHAAPWAARAAPAATAMGCFTGDQGASPDPLAVLPAAPGMLRPRYRGCPGTRRPVSQGGNHPAARRCPERRGGMGWAGMGRGGPGCPSPGGAAFVPALSKHRCRRWHRWRERGSYRPTPRPRSRTSLLRAPLGGGEPRYPSHRSRSDFIGGSAAPVSGTRTSHVPRRGDTSASSHGAGIPPVLS